MQAAAAEGTTPEAADAANPGGARQRRHRPNRRRAGGRGVERDRHLHDDHPLLPALVRGHRALRRGVRHLQHALDHGRAADAGVRDPAHARRVAATGAEVRDPRGARDRPRRLHRRPVRRPRARRRAERALQGAEPRPAADPDGLRDAHDRRLAARRHARDAGRRPLPGDPRDPGASDRRGSRGRDDAARTLRALHAVHRERRRRARGARARLRDARRRHRHRRPIRPARHRCPRAVHRGRDALVAARAAARAPRRHPRAATRRRGRQDRRAKRAAQPGPHGRDRGRADDRDRARDVHLRPRQRPARVEQRRDRAPDPVRPDRHVAGRLLRVPGCRRRRRRRRGRRRDGQQRPPGHRADRRRRREPHRPGRPDHRGLRLPLGGGLGRGAHAARRRRRAAAEQRRRGSETSPSATPSPCAPPDNRSKDFVVRGIYEGSPFYPLLGSASISQEAFDELYDRPRNRFTLLNVADDARRRRRASRARSRASRTPASRRGRSGSTRRIRRSSSSCCCSTSCSRSP